MEGDNLCLLKAHCRPNFLHLCFVKRMFFLPLRWRGRGEEPFQSIGFYLKEFLFVLFSLISNSRFRVLDEDKIALNIVCVWVDLKSPGTETIVEIKA